MRIFALITLLGPLVTYGMNTTATPSPIDCSGESDSWMVDPIGNAPHVKFHAPCGSVDQSLKLRVTSLREYDSNDEVTNNTVGMYALQGLTWTEDEDEDVNSLSTSKDTYTGSLSVGDSSVDFTFSTYMFSESGYITVANTTAESVNKRTFLWSVSLEDWPFEDTDNTLEMCVEIVNLGVTNFTALSLSSPDAFVLYDMLYRFTDEFECTTTGTRYETATTSLAQDYGDLEVCITLSYACPQSGSGTLKYDAIIAYTLDSNVSVSISSSSDDHRHERGGGAVVVIVVVIVVLLLLAGLGFYYKKRQEDDSQPPVKGEHVSQDTGNMDNLDGGDTTL